MASTILTSCETAAAVLARGASDRLKTLIREELKLHADTIIENIAQQLTSDLTTVVRSWDDPFGMHPKILLKIDGAEKAISDLKAL